MPSSCNRGGPVATIYQVAKRLSIVQALGSSQEGKLALWQVIARVIDQGSRLSAVRLAMHHAALEVIGLKEGFHEEHLYQNLAWLGSWTIRRRSKIGCLVT